MKGGRREREGALENAIAKLQITNARVPSSARNVRVASLFR